MVFGNPDALWLLTVVILILALGFWGWRVKKEIIWVGLDENRSRRSQIKKYAVAAAILIFLITALATPRLPILLPGGEGKTGLIVPIVDVTRSMAAKKDLGSPSRLERVKPLLYEIIDRFPEAEFYPFHFTSLARSLTPPVTKEDFPYLKRSIARVLDTGSVPGSGSSIPEALSDVVDKIPKDKKPKIIVIFSDGEPFSSYEFRTENEKEVLERAIRKANQENIKIITVGMGEKEGATIPLYDEEGKFTGEYAKHSGKVYTTYLEEEILKKMASRTGGKYFSEDEKAEIISYIGRNLVSSGDSGEQTEYRDMGYPFLFLFAVLWIIFARYYLR